MLGDDAPGRVKFKKFCHIPMPIHFVIKHRNQGKIESHKWFFKGFCEYMQPEFAQIIDCGSIALWNSISRIVKFLDRHKAIGAATGEIEVILPEKNIETGQEFSFSESILLKSQYVEYKTATYFDKAMESLFNFVSVLPGAFSTFRWKCINGHPLDEFLKGSKDEFGTEGSQMSCSTANRYLAEDRIMCLEILACEGNWTISYVPGAKCLTDPPLTLKGLMKQRRRWYNGSLFATYYVLNNLRRVICRKGCCKALCRNILFFILYIYMLISTFLAYILVGAFYATFSMFVRSVFKDDDGVALEVANVLENIYLTFVFLIIMLSTAVKLDWAEFGFWIASVLMGSLSIVMVVSSILFSINGELKLLVALFLASYILLIFLPIILNLNRIKICAFLKGSVYAIYLAPTYINILTIYAISNIHDVSWGSRPDTNGKKVDARFAKAEKQREINYKNYRSNFLIIWMIANIIVANSITYASRNEHTWILIGIAVFLTGIIGFKIIFCTLFMLVSKCKSMSLDTGHGQIFKRVSFLCKTNQFDSL